jgi:hypothetical protein
MLLPVATATFALPFKTISWAARRTEREAQNNSQPITRSGVRHILHSHLETCIMLGGEISSTAQQNDAGPRQHNCSSLWAPSGTTTMGFLSTISACFKWVTLRPEGKCDYYSPYPFYWSDC